MLAESLRLCQAVGDHWTAAFALRELARSFWVVGELSKAKRYAEESLTISRTLQNIVGITSILRVLNWVTMEEDEYEAALSYAKEDLMLSTQLGSRHATSNAIFNMGTTYLKNGNFVEASAYLAEAGASAKAAGNLHHENSCTSWRAEAEIHLGNYPQAMALLQQGLQRAEEMGLRSHRGDALANLARVCLVQNEYDAAKEYLEESRQIIQASRHLVKLTWILAPLGYTARALNNSREAHQHLHQLLQGACTHGHKRAGIRTLPLAALLLADAGEVESSQALYATALKFGFVANSRWYADVVGKQLDAVAATLPPAVVAAAKARGRQQDPLTCARQLLDGPLRESVDSGTVEQVAIPDRTNGARQLAGGQ